MSFTISAIPSRPYTPGFENGFTVPLRQNPVPSPQMGLGVPLSLIPFSVSHPSFRSHGGEWRVRLQNFRPGLPALAAGVGLMMGVLTPTEAMAQQNANSPTKAMVQQKANPGVNSGIKEIAFELVGGIVIAALIGVVWHMTDPYYQNHLK